MAGDRYPRVLAGMGPCSQFPNAGRLELRGPLVRDICSESCSLDTEVSKCTGTINSASLECALAQHFHAQPTGACPGTQHWYARQLALSPAGPALTLGEPTGPSMRLAGLPPAYLLSGSRQRSLT